MAYQHDDEAPPPKWLDEENDQSHQEEIRPLFGTGQLSLVDKDDSSHNNENPNNNNNNNKKPTGYGAINNNNNSHSDEEDDSEDEEGDDDDSSRQELTSSKNNNNKPVGFFGAVSSKIKKRASWKPDDDPSQPRWMKKSNSRKGLAPNKKTSSKSKTIVITESGKPEYPHRNCLLGIFCFLEAYGVITSLCLMTTQIFPILLMPISELGAMNLILKIYISLFCLLFVLLEWDAPIPFLRAATFLQRYFSRGFLYSFLGLSCLEESYSERVNDVVEHSDERFHVSWLPLFMQVSSWMMVSMGAVYMVLGLCCMKVIRDRMTQEHRERMETYREAMKIYKENGGGVSSGSEIFLDSQG